MEALQRANDIRVKRAQLKRDLKNGLADIEEILKNPPEYVATAKVFDMLMAVPKFGRVKATRFLNQCRISQSKTVGGLSDRQRSRADWPLQPLAAWKPVFVVTGPSGAGKGTLDQARCSSASPELELAVSATTRRARGEEDGREYWFLSDEEFDAPRRRGRVPRVRRLRLRGASATGRCAPRSTASATGEDAPAARARDRGRARTSRRRCPAR